MRFAVLPGDGIGPQTTDSLAGGLGLAGSINAGESLVMLFEWLGEEPLLRGARAISAAVEALLKSCATRTRELGGTLGSKAFTGLVIERL